MNVKLCSCTASPNHQHLATGDQCGSGGIVPIPPTTTIASFKAIHSNFFLLSFVYRYCTTPFMMIYEPHMALYTILVYIIIVHVMPRTVVLCFSVRRAKSDEPKSQAEIERRQKNKI